MEKEYQLCLKEMNYEEKLKELTEKFNQQMDSITKQNQVLNSEKDKQKRLKAITGRAAKELQDLESLELQLRLQRIKKNYEKKMQKLKDGHARALEDIMQVKLKEKELELGHVRNGPAHRTAPDHTHIAV
ncbi:cilia- and flagella-associated protein 57-like [Tachysurus fulvidraco]|uniref:cilia- and flagella-associated protein 57-like n=1 Tax=Tachysurus fulvidraco TaxID=1234273 RepID=UPI000F4E9D4D|nr:cilia- and flagella-associated protein 57-like [Tachysurus fulvidraco]